MELNYQDFTVDFITRDEELPAVLETLRASDSIAVDTESNSLFVYFEKVCLVQVSTRDHHYILDPTTLDELDRLGEIFASDRIEKIFHAGEYDVMCLKRDYGFTFANVFDTMIAARILGREEVGLGSLLAAEFDVVLNKKFQKANWGKRPLTEEMIRYAASDTMYLHALRRVLGEELSERGLLELAAEDFAHLCETPCASNRPPEACWWRVTKEASELSQEQAIRLQALVGWREKIAEREDSPNYRVVRNEVLTDLALHPPKSYREMTERRGLGEWLKRKHGKSLWTVLRSDLDPSELTQPEIRPMPDAVFMQRRQAMRDWRKQVGIKLGVPSDVILPRELMDKIIHRAPKDEVSLADVMRDYPWRYQRFGAAILDELANERAEVSAVAGEVNG